MKSLAFIITFYAMVIAPSLFAQELSVNNKTVKVEELPEYIIIQCDNSPSILVSGNRIEIHAKKSPFEKMLEDLEDLLEDKWYLNMSNQTDLLNTMSKLGFDYINAIPQQGTEGSFGRAGLVFRKKEKYRG